ncbi:IspD/TarI family cytidylyltransferase [Cellulomonas marina]|nr:2-C-methyl-D-erythritol 4-phosphate cytidylyltransferase [Cellulomonas marina]
MTTAAVLTAAGSGRRLGAAGPKALVPLAGEPLVLHAARRLAASGVVVSVVVTVPPGGEAPFASVLPAELDGVPVRLVAGGASRQASVAAGLAVLGPDVDVVLVHDAARALAGPGLVRAVEAEVRAGRAAVVPGLPVTDTLKRVGRPQVAPGTTTVHGAAGGPVPGPAGAPPAWPVLATVDRGELRAVQTPQGFDRALLDRAHAAAAHLAGDEATALTDDAGLVEALGAEVWVVPGEERAMKVTTAHDLAVARLLLDEGDQG